MKYSKIIDSILLVIIAFLIVIISFNSLAQVVITSPNVPINPFSGTIKGKVFFDANNNGIDDDATFVLNNVFLNVLRAPGTTQAQLMLKSDGKFEFAVQEGEYKLEFTTPGYEATKKGKLTISNDSDINKDSKTDYVLVNTVNNVVILNAGVIKITTLPVEKPKNTLDWIYDKINYYYYKISNKIYNYKHKIGDSIYKKFKQYWL